MRNSVVAVAVVGVLASCDRGAKHATPQAPRDAAAPAPRDAAPPEPLDAAPLAPNDAAPPPTPSDAAPPPTPSDAAPPPPRHAAPALGIIRGVVTHTMNGPGRAHAPEESFSTTRALECKVGVIDPRGARTDVKTSADGKYQLEVAPGHYTVSFDACASPSCQGAEPKKTVDVAAHATVEASFDCEVYAK